MKVSGKESSAVGLMAYVARDPESKQLVLERYEIQLLNPLEIANVYFYSGALVLSDGGLLY